MIAKPGSTGPQDGTGDAIPTRSQIGKKYDDWSEKTAKPTAFSDHLESKADGAHPDLHGLTRSLHEVTKDCVMKSDYEGVKKAANEYSDLVTKMGQVFDGARKAGRAKADLDTYTSLSFNDAPSEVQVTLKAVQELGTKIDGLLKQVSTLKADTELQLKTVSEKADAAEKAVAASTLIVQRGAQAGDDAVSTKADGKVSDSDFVREMRMRSQLGQPQARTRK